MSILSFLSAIFFVASAFFWYRSTKVKINFASLYAGETDEENLITITKEDYCNLLFKEIPTPTNMSETIKYSSIFNHAAASCAAIGAAFQAIVAFAQFCAL